VGWNHLIIIIIKFSCIYQELNVNLFSYACSGGTDSLNGWPQAVVNRSGRTATWYLQ
jgi:hypothetical protein